MDWLWASLVILPLCALAWWGETHADRRHWKRINEQEAKRGS